MSEQIKIGTFAFFVILFTLVNTVAAFAFHPPTFSPLSTSDTANCDLYEGEDIHFSYLSDSSSSAFTATFLLTDTNNIILQVRDTTRFINVSEGCYFVYALEYKLGTTIQGNVVGNRVSDITSSDNCLDIPETNPYPITVCPIPDSIKIVSGRIFYDLNEDGLNNDDLNKLAEMALEIYEDNNQNGLIDGGDSLLTVIMSDSLGFYSHTIDETLLGRTVTHLIVKTDSTTIPSERYYTTDNLEVVVFLTTQKIVTNNDFGISQTIDLENEVWLDLNANAIQETIEVNIANMEIYLINQSPLLINGISYPANTYRDTVITDANGIFIFENLPDGNWQLITNHDAAQYIPTYDADGGILNSTNFSLSEGVVSATNNAWCASPNCLPDLKFGFRLAGDLSLSGNVCIDDGSKNGNCSTGTEEPLASMVLTIFNEAGDMLGGVATNQTGSYSFPNLPEDSYVVYFAKEQISFKDYFFTTEIGATPALKIVEANKSILQKVLVQAAVFGVDFAFFPHPTIIAKDDLYTTCPGLIFEHHNVSLNDSITSNLNRYQLLIPPTLGTVEMEVNGKFKYIPIGLECDRDEFTYQVCDLIAEVCDTANVSLVFEDEKAPTLLNVPPDLTINCDEYIPARTLVSAFDNCPSINVSLQETSSQGEDGCSLYDYTLMRTWIATDVCKNSTSATQIIKIEDKEPPSIFRIYTLPNGKKLVAGISKLVGAGWKKVSLPLDFKTVPLIFSQIISANNSILPVVQTRNISSAQFEIRLQKEEPGNETYSHEKVAWIALEGGAQSTDFILNASTVLVDTSPTEINFFTEFLSNPLLFASLQTTNQQNPVRVTYSNLTSSEVSVKLIETKNQELERNLTEEKVAYLGIENIGDLFDNKGNIIGEIGTKLINGGSNKIVLNHTYHNPIILVSPYNNVEHSSQLRVSEVLNDNFQIQSSPLGALNFVPQPTTISYLVIEGSIPLHATDFCTNNTDDLQIGVDIVAIDNCDRLAVVSYSEQHDFNGTAPIINRSWQSSDECGNQVAYSQKIQCPGVGIVLQTFLQGALIGSKEEGLMRDDLRRKGLIPVNEPYSILPNFKHIGSGGGEVIARELLEVTGPNAIVDWVFLELREAENFDTIVATSSGLLQRNGNVISVMGDSVVIFKNVPWGDYYITIRHRNHIGISSQNAYTFGLNTIPKIDFRNVFTATNGNYSSIKMSDTNAQWAGDTNGDEKIIYQGPNNDPIQMFYRVILDEKNSHYLTNYISRGYLIEDFNMDGITIYQGPNNDRSLLLYNTIFAHPNNRNFITNFIINIANGH